MFRLSQYMRALVAQAEAPRRTAAPHPSSGVPGGPLGPVVI